MRKLAMQPIRTSVGFTLIELLVVLAIVAALATVAIPGYQSFIEKSRRSDAIAELMTLALSMERDFTSQGRYDTSKNNTTVHSESCFYALSYEVPDSNTFTITAEPFPNNTSVCNGKSNGSQSAQLGDEDCQKISVNQALSFTSKNASDTDSTESCIRQ